MKGLRTALTLACIGLFATPAHAQAYLTKPVTIVVTLAAGGAADVIARALAQRLTEEWGQPVLIENKGGANNQVGTASVARAAADGYTLLLTPEHTFTVNPFLYRRLSYDAVKDFTPITGVVTISQALAVHPSLPAKTTAELVALAKGKPGELNYGGLGAGSGPHLSMELLQAMTGAKLNAVHYKGAAPALSEALQKIDDGVTGLATDPDGSLYVACWTAVFKVKMDGTVTTLAHPIEVKDCDEDKADHKPTNRLPYMRGLAVDSEGTVYAAATSCHGLL